ncbi:Uncharacterised protein [Mycobacteroides abscessus subsp. abscessus]|nr:Uncharacterised protein [Mycobacteroides abscessus subsp. abscessus]
MIKDLDDALRFAWAARTADPDHASTHLLALAIESLCDLLATRNDGEKP